MNVITDYYTGTDSNKDKRTVITAEGDDHKVDIDLSHEALADLISDHVEGARSNGYPQTPMIGTEYLIGHMDMGTFGNNVHEFIREQLEEYVSDAVYDAELTIAGN